MAADKIISVFLDPGHGGEDPGAVGNGITEKDYVLDFSRALFWILSGTLLRPHMSRVDDEDLGLDHAAEIGKTCDANFALAIHVNSNKSPAVGGMMAFYLPGDDVGRRVANEMQSHAPVSMRRRSSSATAATPKSWRRVCNVLNPYRERNIGCSLIELGFLSNQNDALFLSTPLIRHQLIGSILSGLEQLRYVFGE